LEPILSRLIHFERIINCYYLIYNYI